MSWSSSFFEQPMELDWNSDDEFLEALIGGGCDVSPMMSKSYRRRILQDQYFLVVFIIGMFFGPDLKGDNPKTPALKKCIQTLPPYTSDQLAGSQLQMTELTRVYYYVLRKADASVIMDQPLLSSFFQGNLQPGGDGLQAQLPDLFDHELHPRSYRDIYQVIENVVFINNPDTSFLDEATMDKFRRLTGLEDLLLDINVIYEHIEPSNAANVRPEPQILVHEEVDEAGDMAGYANANYGYGSMVVYAPPAVQERSNSFDSPNVDSEPEIDQQEVSQGTGDMAESEVTGERSMIIYEPPTVREWSNFSTAANPPEGIEIHYEGSIANHPIGPQIGLMDIGDSLDAYYFRVALPGVSTNNTDFSCHVEPDGKVLIRGISVTGQSHLLKHRQIFVMRTQNLPPPGPFTVTFNLPGPVEPDEFSFKFGDHGLLEAYVLKKNPE